MKNNYSKSTFSKIMDTENKFSYDFLQPEFDERKKVMEKK